MTSGFTFKMAAAYRNFSQTRSFLKISRLLSVTLQQSRTLAHLRSSAELTDTRKYQDDVYLLNYRPKPTHDFVEALNVLRSYAISNADETVELHLKINMGEKKYKIQAFRGTVLMPKPFGSQRTVLVFAEGDDAQMAKEAGADTVGGEELFEQVKEGTLSFDQCLSTLDMLDKVKPLQRILRQKMPTTRRGTATDDIVTAIRTYKQGHPYKCDKHGYLNAGIGKLSFADDEIKVNAQALIQTVYSHRVSSKGKFITRVMLSSTHGPGLLLNAKDIVP
ncbi:50S ribosomal protein L1 [Nematostella vectensis]|uniref:50S ribosomal protein L1 n=1 Tax=Nematostella vectensis TaxID=45351 RepID=UPI0020773607|nr:50S ribosomal protein L1 [Nematostella vectensis]